MKIDTGKEVELDVSMEDYHAPASMHSSMIKTNPESITAGLIVDTYHGGPSKKKTIWDIFKCQSSTATDQEAGKNESKYNVKSQEGQKKLSDENSWIRIYLNWCFETSFVGYFMSAFVIFTVGLIIFSLLLLGLTNLVGRDENGDHICVGGWDMNFFEQLSASFVLSWTTFSTVGYGNIYPNIRSTCAYLNIICALESLMGVLYAGFCGAILFAKVQNEYSSANLIFSDVCILRFGRGVVGAGDELNEMEDEDEVDSVLNPNPDTNAGFKSPSGKSAPYPILIFRLVNTRANSTGGSIMNLELNTVAVIEKWHSSEEGDATLRRLFRPLSVEPNTVPLFERVMYVRHLMDQNSPLLKPETRKMIAKNNGRWPASICTAEAIRNSLCFSEIIVSLEGVSDISKATVYAQKKYQNTEVKIGWRFTNMTYKSDDNTFRVDIDTLNVIKEQLGGGGEPLR